MPRTIDLITFVAGILVSPQRDCTQAQISAYTACMACKNRRDGRIAVCGTHVIERMNENVR